MVPYILSVQEMHITFIVVILIIISIENWTANTIHINHIHSIQPNSIVS